MYSNRTWRGVVLPVVYLNSSFYTCILQLSVWYSSSVQKKNKNIDKKKKKEIHTGLKHRVHCTKGKNLSVLVCVTLVNPICTVNETFLQV